MQVVIKNQLWSKADYDKSWKYKPFFLSDYVS